MKVVLPDGSVKEYAKTVSPLHVASEIGEGLAKATIGARVTTTEHPKGELWDADRPMPDVDEVQLSLITAPRLDKKKRSKWRDDAHQTDALYLLRHSCAHIMAEAIERLWPDTQLAYGPPLENGFYYDLALDTPISSDDFEKIEVQMRKIVEEDRAFTRYELSSDEGLAKVKAENNKYKLDNANRALENGSESLSWYVTGDPGVDHSCGGQTDHTFWEDLCMGPHVPSTGSVAAFKLMTIASSHWHGDVNSDRFQRIYGTAFFSQADLDDHLEKLEEAKKRDHRLIGQRLGLFTISEKVGQGLILWKPDGAIIRQELQNFISEHLERQGYFQVFTPHIGKLDLYRTSGHYPYYKESQFTPILEEDQIKALASEGCNCSQLANMMDEGDVEGFMLKPMNCPHHIQIYASEKRSYRDLPIRLAEFGTVYRWEQSGELNGMTRVRGFTQDDAHLFVTPDQLHEEVQGCLELVKVVFQTLGMTDYRVRVGLRDPDSNKFVGTPEQWDQAENACKQAAESLGVPFSAEAGEAAFYGPKIDFVVRDVIGREWQLGTVQVDYQLPHRFDLEYTGSDNAAHRPIMIHRAPFGSMERFVGVLIEHFAGSFPLWLTPKQLRVLPISDKFNAYGESVLKQLKETGFRAEIDTSSNRINGKIKNAEEERVYYMLVVGGRDMENRTVSVRARGGKDLGAIALDEFIERIRIEKAERRVGSEISD